MPVTSARTGFLFAAPALAIVVLSSCVLEPSRRGAPAPVSSSVLSERQISAALASTAYDAIQHLRPIALRIGGAKSLEPSVYLDGMKLGGVAELQRIPAAGLAEIRFLNPVEASAIYGPSQRGGGAIVLTSKIFAAGKMVR